MQALGVLDISGGFVGVQLVRHCCVRCWYGFESGNVVAIEPQALACDCEGLDTLYTICMRDITYCCKPLIAAFYPTDDAMMWCKAVFGLSAASKSMSVLIHALVI